MKKMNLKKQPFNRVWRLSPQEAELCACLARGLQLPLPAAQVLLNRGVDSVKEGEAFLRPGIAQLHSPFSMQDMERAVQIVLTALCRGRRIAVFGDYDVDGVTAAAILFMLLQEMGGDVLFYLPNRLQEGYGLNRGAIDFLRSRDVSLLITVDCGITNIKEVEYARDAGMEVIVTDHHQPADVLPAAGAVLNPWREDCPYPFTALCGAGVAFKLGQALCSRRGEEDRIWNHLDLVALGTVADVVPLKGENRALVALGLKQMGKAMRPGLKAIREVAGVKNEKVTAEEIAFIIAPRLNAAGRMGNAERALKLLLAAEKEEASLLARELQAENNRRQALEAKILKEACALVQAGPPERVGQDFLLLARPGWHTGVLGIVASRLAERFSRPALLIALENGEDGESRGEGSGRSFGDFDLEAALKQCSTLLLGFGGHRQAAGLTVAGEKIPRLREKLDLLAGEFFGEEGPTATLSLDAPLEPEDVTPELVRALQLLEPFGHGNPPPLFWGRRWQLKRKREVGKGGRHLQLGVQKKGFYFAGISFNGKTRLPPLSPGQEIDLAFNVAFDEWRGNEALQLEILDCLHAPAEPGRGGERGLNIIDRRGLKDKQHYIRELWGQGAEILVLVNTVKRRQGLAKVFAGMPGVFFSHQGAWPTGGSAGMPGHFVLYDLPLSEKILKEILARLQAKNSGHRGMTVHLLYDRRDFQENLKLLRATVPAFFSLEQVFFSLQKEIGAQDIISREKATRKLQKTLPFPVTEHLLKKSMEILAAARYLELNERKIILRRRVHDFCSLHKDLAGIRDFRLEKDKWKRTLSWQQFLLNSAGNKILDSLE